THIIDTVLARMGEMYPCDVVTVTLLDPGEEEVATSFIRGGGAQAEREEAECRLTAGDRQFLERNSRMIVLLPEEGDSHPGYLKLAVDAGAHSFVLLPLIVKDQLSGVIALGHRQPTGTSPDDLEHARGLADQVAVALTNVRMLDQVRFLAYYDSLTHLPNRVLNRERLQLALMRARRERQQVAVFFLDLDHFGRINDTLGHDLGDQLVRDVASRVSSCCRATDSVGRKTTETLTSVARLGGDEFTVILPDLDEPQSAARVAQRLLQTFTEPFSLGGQEVFVTASIGIAIYPDDGDDIEGLLKNADSAMYYAKQQGRNNFQMYSRSMNETALTRLTLENELRRSVERHEFVMHYQPVADLVTGRIVGMEALVRWKHPRLGLVSPLSFIPLAEDTGLIGPLGEWILRSACAQNRAWQDAGLPPIRVAVNLSSRQFRQRDLIEMVRRV
ncbi:MAG: putative bifunctional diguanylate cyclase/phosphodiesterase, partial [Gemmatimonadales bacterium]